MSNETIERVNEIMHGKGQMLDEFRQGDRLCQVWRVGCRLVMVVIFKNGGCIHLIQSLTLSWIDMKLEIDHIAAGNELPAPRVYREES